MLYRHSHSHIYTRYGMMDDTTAPDAVPEKLQNLFVSYIRFQKVRTSPHCTAPTCRGKADKATNAHSELPGTSVQQWDNVQGQIDIISTTHIRGENDENKSRLSLIYQVYASMNLLLIISIVRQRGSAHTTRPGLV